MTEPTDPAGEADEAPEAPGVGEAPEPTGDPAATGDPAPDGAASEEMEGPRRRARREREERRAAQARARALEEARRAAKQRLRGADAPTARSMPRGAVRGLKMLLWGLFSVVTVVGLGLLLYFTPLMSARQITVEGIAALSDQEVRDAVQVKIGTPLLQIDTGRVADRVASIRRVASARVQRQYPSTLRVSVVERIPVAVRDFPDGPHLFDRDGVDFATAPPPPGLPYLDVDEPGPTDPATRAAMAVLTALRPEVVGQVGRIGAPSVASITLTLVDGRVVVWGTSDRTQEKADKLAALLTQPGHTYDVSSPDLPTVR